MFVIWGALNGKHHAMEMGTKAVERKIKRLRGEEAQASMVVTLQAYGRPTETVEVFKYLGRVLTASDDNC